MRIQLRIYTQPGGVEAYINLKRRDGGYRTVTAWVDTGAAVSLLPDVLRSELDYRLSERGNVVIQQAGIAGQHFEATEAYVTVNLEDQTGTRTPDFEIRVWFAEANDLLLGFDSVLDHSILHVDMLNLQGWLDVDV